MPGIRYSGLMPAALISPHMDKHLPYDRLRDFAHVAIYLLRIVGEFCKLVRPVIDKSACRRDTTQALRQGQAFANTPMRRVG